MVNDNKNQIWFVFFVTKLLQQHLSISDSLLLVQLKYSLHTFCSQPEKNYVLNQEP